MFRSAPALREKYVDPTGHEFMNIHGARINELPAAEKDEFATRVKLTGIKPQD